MHFSYGALELPTRCIMSARINKIRKIKNITFAISAAAIAIPVNPNTPAMIAIIKNVTTQPNMMALLIFLLKFCNTLLSFILIFFISKNPNKNN